jgi:dTDP-4-amino-4,6-dideoxygalactose transaminase
VRNRAFRVPMHADLDEATQDRIVAALRAALTK